MDDDFTLEERIEAWRKRWNTKIGADLFKNRKEDLKALFRPRRWTLSTSEKLAGRLFRVKEYHDINKVCPKCYGHRSISPAFPTSPVAMPNRVVPSPPGLYTDAQFELGYYNERLDRYGQYQINETESPRYVMPGSVVFATGKFIERQFWESDTSVTTIRHIEILTEKAIGYICYDYLRPIKKSEVKKPNQ